MSGPLIAIAIVLALLVLWLLLRPKQGQMAANAPDATPAVRPSESLDADPSDPDISDAENEVQQLMIQGRKIEAIKRVRALTGMGLKDAKDYVEALPDTPPSTHLGSSRLPLPIEPPGLEAEVRRLLAQHRKIEAVKRVRERMGVNLKQAKDYVESFPISTLNSDLDTPLIDHPKLEAEVRQLLTVGKTIQAIRRVREDTGLGLLEAKNYVESLRRSSLSHE